MINGLIWLVKRSWRRNHLSSWRSCQETVNFKGLIHPPVPCVKVCVCLSLEWCPSWSRCPGLVVSGGRGAECFQPVRAAFLNKALFVFRAHSLEPARREQKSDLYGLPGELLLLSSDRTDCVCVCVCASENVHVIFCFKLLFPTQAYWELENFVYSRS